MNIFSAQIICNDHFVQKLICSQVFSSYEKWEFFDALYYCFATLTTIGSYLAFQRSSKWLFKDKSSCFSKITYYLLFKDNLFSLFNLFYRILATLSTFSIQDLGTWWLFNKTTRYKRDLSNPTVIITIINPRDKLS